MLIKIVEIKTVVDGDGLETEDTKNEKLEKKEQDGKSDGQSVG